MRSRRSGNMLCPEEFLAGNRRGQWAEQLEQPSYVPVRAEQYEHGPLLIFYFPQLPPW